MIILSILIPTYNYKLGLIDILDSFLRCDKKELNKIEIIIGDDSTKKIISTKKLRNYRSYIHNLTYINNPQRGVANNWNNLIEISKGRYYWLLCHNEFLINPKDSLPKILKNLERNKLFLILPIIKEYRFSFLSRFRVNLKMKHTLTKNLLKVFIKQNTFILFLNVIGPPSALIVKKTTIIKYRKDLKWLIDVEYYSNLFKNIKNNNYKIFTEKEASVASNQNFNNSITNLLKKNKFEFYKLKDQELLLILKNKQKIFIYSVFISIIWFIFKLLNLLNLKLRINFN